MKVVGICGSPRKGNTEWMLRKLLEGADQGEVETVSFSTVQPSEKLSSRTQGPESRFNNGFWIRDMMKDTNRKDIVQIAVMGQVITRHFKAGDSLGLLEILAENSESL